MNGRPLGVRAVYVLLFCVLIAETPMMFEGQWSTPLALLGRYVIEGSPVKLRWVDIWMILIALMAMVRSKAVKAPAKPMTRAIWLGVGTSLAFMAYGVARGGDWKQAIYQNHAYLSSLFFALLCLKVLRTKEDFYGLGKAIVCAAVWRSFMAILFYIVIIRTGRYTAFPSYFTTHDDTVLFTLSIVGVLFNAFELRTRRAVGVALVVVPILLLAVHLNNRRIAWVSLTSAGAVAYLLLRPSPLKRKLNLLLLVAAPFAVAYVLVGRHYASSPSVPMIFKPIAALFSSVDETNLSTRARIAENLGLMVTFISSPVLGTGFGHQYTDVDSTLAARYFTQYLYVPHNSVLGFMAFTGVVGFLGLWMVFPTNVFLSVRTYREAPDPVVRVLAGSSVAGVLIFLNQAFGDMGLFSFQCLYMVGACHAAAARLSTLSGAWGKPAAHTPAITATEEPAAPSAPDEKEG